MGLPGVFIEEAHKRNLKVTVSTTIFPAGRPDTKEGVVYRDQELAKHTVLENTSKGMIDIKDDRSKVAAFLNPALPEVQEYALKFIKEIVSNYDIDGYALDYCRYPGIEGDFSQATIDQFEKYIGEKIVNFPGDIFRWEGTTRRDGKFAKKWFEFSLEKGKRLFRGDCKMYGSISAYNWKDIGDATTLCLEASDGLVVFDIVHVIQFNTWDQLKKAIGDYNVKTE